MRGRRRRDRGEKTANVDVAGLLALDESGPDHGVRALDGLLRSRLPLNERLELRGRRLSRVKAKLNLSAGRAGVEALAGLGILLADLNGGNDGSDKTITVWPGRE